MHVRETRINNRMPPALGHALVNLPHVAREQAVPAVVSLANPSVTGAAEVLQYTGVTNFAEPRWWNVGAAKLNGEDLNYLGVPGLRIAGGQGILIIAFCQVGTCADSLTRCGVPVA